MEKERSLSNLLELARTIELSDTRAKRISEGAMSASSSTSETVSKLTPNQSTRPKQGHAPRKDSRRGKPTCFRCGFDYPHENRCHAEGKECRSCGLMNHFARCCRSSASSTRTHTKENMSQKGTHTKENPGNQDYTGKSQSYGNVKSLDQTGQSSQSDNSEKYVFAIEQDSHKREIFNKNSNQRDTSDKNSHQRETFHKKSNQRDASGKNTHQRETFHKNSNQRDTSDKNTHQRETFYKNSNQRDASDKNTHQREIFHKNSNQRERPIRTHTKDKPSKRTQTKEIPPIRTHTKEKPSIRTQTKEIPPIRTHTKEKPSIRTQTKEIPLIRTHTKENPPIRTQTKETSQITHTQK